MKLIVAVVEAVAGVPLVIAVSGGVTSRIVIDRVAAVLVPLSLSVAVTDTV